MRKNGGRFVAAVLVLLLISGFAFQDSIVGLYVRLNSAALERFALTALADCGGEFLSVRYGPWDVTAWKQAGVVEFHTGRSAAFGGIEKGFYYSGGDTPNSFQATGYPMAEDGVGWKWEDPYGNHGSTGRITPKWFWYKAVL